ncbi:ABC transporter ATP-binding protein [Brevibacillus sp. AG]|uniref:ABC transporter ATP-binding protein n=1 Tax=Brevibacillus sp. AG TaxID=3020891 RepID=UPI000852D720|nr:ABC transporter ATP-binding protein [Brevibacillus sp. AG]MDC0762322.1 ABC transporter ATP-binding protein [Brevibacillus sp. AG]
MTTLLDVQKLSRDFGGVRAVNQVDFQVREGEILALIGPNGAGKSTVLNMVSGVISPSEGEIRFSNQPLTRVQGYEYAGLGITRTFQNLQTFDDMTVLENVMVGMHTKTSASLFSCGMNLAKSRKEEKMMQEQAQTWIENVGLAEEASLLAGSLPYGKLRLMEIARAMVAQPRLLLLDEPAAGLNHTETAEMSRMFCEIRDNGTAILLVEHDMDMIMTIADRIVVLDQGSKIAEGTPREIQENPRVIAAYLGAE